MSAGAVIVAAGASTRMGRAGDKTLADIGGEPLIARTVDVFERCDAIAAVAFVVSERNLEAIAALRDAKGWQKTMPPLPGGARRQDSVRAGLDALPPDCDWVLVHDGARPFVTPRMIEDGLAAAAATGAAIAVVPAFDTVKRVSGDGRVVETLDRSELAMVQTPQVFRRGVLERAHAEVADDVTDDAAMVERIGVEVRTFEGARTNIKVTTLEDLALARLMVGSSTNTGWEIRQKHGHETAVLNDALAQTAEALGKAPQQDDDLNKAWMLLAVKNFQSLLSAMLLLDYGYYDQAQVMIRCSKECMLTAIHSATHPQTAKKILNGDRVNFTRMAKDVGSEYSWQSYSVLSTFSHPSGIRAQVRISPEGKQSLPVGMGSYNELRVVSVIYGIRHELLDLVNLTEQMFLRFGGYFPAGNAADSLRSLKEYMSIHLRQLVLPAESSE